MSTSIGKPIARLDGRAKVTGSARYAADAVVPGVVHGVLVTSTIARGRVTEIDTRAAEAATGVLAVLTHRTMPRLHVPNAGYYKGFLPIQDERVHHSGQPVAYVVARTLEQAQYAADLVWVTYAAERPRTSLETAMGEAYVPPSDYQPNEVVRGDTVAGFARAEVTVEAAFTTPTHHHNPIEPSTTTAIWDGDRLTVHESTQGISNTRNSLAQAFGLPHEDIRVISLFVGGGFGAKAPVWPHTVLTAAAARVVGRPVKLVLTRAQTYTSNGHRAQTHQKLVVGATRDGRLTAIEHLTTQQVSRTEDIPFNSSEATRLLYACPNLRSVQRVVPLDLPMSMFMRSPEAVVSHGLETTLDELSYALELDPVELRLRNFTDTNQDTGQRYGSNHLVECYRRAAATFGWAKRDPRPASMRDEHGLIGWGMATAAHTAGGWPGSAAKVEVRTDGTALIQSGTQDIGTGTYTVMTQLGADVLGLPPDAVRFELGDSAFPAAFASAASSTVPSVGSAITRAATAVRDAVIAIAVADPRSPLHSVNPALVTAADGQLAVADRRDSYRDVLARHGKPVTVTSKPEHTPLGYSVGAAFAEVQVDPLIGRVRVRRIVTCYDPGTVLNHHTARSQAIGGAVWAIGFVLSEHSSIDHQLGRIVNANLSGYLVPVNADVPEIEVEFIDRPDPSSPAMGARGFGETPMTGVTAAIGNAIFHATGRRVRDLPITQDKLL